MFDNYYFILIFLENNINSYYYNFNFTGQEIEAYRGYYPSKVTLARKSESTPSVLLHC